MSDRTSTTKNHVFLFRHCVRSTDSNVYLFNNTVDDNNNDVSIPVSNFWSRLSQPEVIVPQWNVPKNWCTENGMKQMQQTGSYIYNTLLARPKEEGGGRKLKFRFISDTSQRDIDTTFALQEGIASAMLSDTALMDIYAGQDGSPSTISLASTNVHSAEYIPNLFQPFVSTTMSPTPMCTLQATPQQLLDEVKLRLSTIVPKPPRDIYSTLKLLLVDGINNGMMAADDMNNVTVTYDSRDRPQLRGMINLLKLVAQMMLYSRASGIEPRQFLHRISTSQLYTILLPYIYYTRSILNVGTTEAATRGAILARTMMDALPIHNDDNVDTVTILVGHDTDLDAVATAMNVAWKFDVPYNIDNNINSSSLLLWYMTPPGSAIYLSHESNADDNEHDNNVVSMSYLHPYYNIDKNDGSITSYDMVPLQLMNYSGGDGNFRINDSSVTIQWEELQRHINDTLRQFAGATECYYSTLPVSGVQQQPGPKGSSNSTGSSPSGPNTGPTIAPTYPGVPTYPAERPTTIPTNQIAPTTTSGTSNQITPATTSSTSNISKSWGSGFASGVAVSVVLVLTFWWYSYRKQRQLRSQYSRPYAHNGLQLAEYSDADDASTVATSNRRDII